jgi:NAD(P)-dependent dehydrogenase (short-subunit alcohol dehydrogenase family)
MNKAAMQRFDLDGKVAMITGSTRGLGETAAKAFAKAGADVAVCGRSSPDLVRVTAEIGSLGGRCDGFFLDVTSRKCIGETVKEILKRFGGIDILVNNAGINFRAGLLDLDETSWDTIIDTNLKGYFLVSQAVAPQMLERGYGKIINVSSIFGQLGALDLSAYAASKGGVNQLTRVMALEWARKGVRVNALAPSYFETDLVAHIRSKEPERMRLISERIPMGRWGQLPELEGAFIFLASAASDFLTGQVICIDGGWTAC